MGFWPPMPPGMLPPGRPGRPGSAREQEQAAYEQQGEREVAEQVQEHRGAVLGVGVRGEVDVLLAELGEELGGGARQLHAHALHTVAQLGDSLDDGDRAVLVQVNLLDAAHVQVLLLMKQKRERAVRGAFGCAVSHFPRTEEKKRAKINLDSLGQNRARVFESRRACSQTASVSSLTVVDGRRRTRKRE